MPPDVISGLLALPILLVGALVARRLREHGKTQEITERDVRHLRAALLFLAYWHALGMGLQLVGGAWLSVVLTALGVGAAGGGVRVLDGVVRPMSTNRSR